MDLQSARAVIRDASASFVDHAHAAMVLADHPHTTREDLEACRERGGYAGNLAELVLKLRAERELSTHAAEPLSARKTA